MHNVAFDMTEEDAKRYLELVIRDTTSRIIQKLFYDCVRIARRLKIALPYRTFLAGFFRWLERNIGGTVHQFLLVVSARDVFARGVEALRRQRIAQEHFWRTTLTNTLH
jgi:hypothetical protein